MTIVFCNRSGMGCDDAGKPECACSMTAAAQVRKMERSVTIPGQIFQFDLMEHDIEDNPILQWFKSAL